jgi:hypothetical protein
MRTVLASRTIGTPSFVRHCSVELQSAPGAKRVMELTPCASDASSA